MPTYESTVGESDLELGQEYFGSIVTKVDQRVSTEIDGDDVEMYIVKRRVTLKNGVTMNEEYRKEVALGKIENKKYELPKGHFGDEPLKDDSDARAKAKAMMKDKKKKKSRPKKNKSLPPNSPKKLTSPTRSPRKKKSRSKSISGMEEIQPWFNFDEMKNDEPKKERPKSRPKPKDVGKLKLEEIWAEKIPTTAIVYPRNDAPDCHDDPDKEIIIAKGTWKFSENKPEPEGADTWVPTYVQLDLDGSCHYVEDDTNIDDNDDESDMYESFSEKPHGVWGLNPSEDANAADPSDLWFYPPDEEMDDDFKPIGKWKMMKESLWPPKSIGQVRDMRKFKQYRGSLNNVGKLKMPAFFNGK